MDTSVFLMAADRSDPRHDCASWLLEQIAKGRFECIVSTVSVSELLTGAMARGASKAVATQTLLRQYPHLQIAPVTMDVAADAADLRVATRIRLPDALILATAVVNGVDVVLHGDAEWTSRVAPVLSRPRLVDLNAVCGA